MDRVPPSSALSAPRSTTAPIVPRTALRGLVLGLAIGTAALSSSAYAQAPVTALPAGDTVKSFDVPAGPLDAALDRFARTAGVNLSYEPEAIAGLTTSGLSGDHRIVAALAALLSGSGLEAVAQPGGGYSLRRIVQGGQATTGAPASRTLPPVRVTADPEPLAAPLPAPYSGGQVGRGARLGMLGNADFMEAPFNVTSYTADLIENQQARSLSEVMQNDASVRSVFAQGSGIDQLYIRGFLSANQDTAFNGRFGIAPSASGVLAVEMYERIEVLKGASSFLYGIAPSGSTGGVINVVPKRASSEPINRLTFSGGSRGMAGIHADVGRRFGPDQMFGVRVNALKRKGEAAWRDNERDTTLGSVGLDVRARRFRASLDLGYQEQRSQVMPVSVRLGPNVAVPRPPEPGASYSQKWTFNDSRNQFAALQGEFDLTSSVQAYASYGWNDLLNEVLSSYPTVNDASTGAMRETAPFHSNTHTERKSAELGLRARFATGAVGHRMTLSVNDFRQTSGLARETLAAIASNLYAPNLIAMPAITAFPSRPPRTEESRFSSLAFADTLELMGDRLKLTLGARSQNVEVSSFNATTGARTAHYDESAVTPFAALVAKASDTVSIYANYIEALSQGPVAPVGTVNVGEVFAPIKSKQYEIGAKADFGRYAVTASVYQINRPSAATDPNTNRYGLVGEQRNRGIELNLFGQPAAGVRVLGGLAIMDGTLSKTAGGVNDGRTAPGVPKWQLNLGGEWDLPALPGLTLTGRIVHTASQYYDPENVRSIPGWSRFDLGMRYAIKGAIRGTHPIILRAAVENVTNRRYWASAVGTFGSELNAGAPRTFLVSASVAF